MDRAEKIKILENLCDEYKLCSGGCPFWHNGDFNISCNWDRMSDKELDMYIDKIGATNAKTQAINPSDAKQDMVSHPPHYNQGGIECIDAIKSAVIGKTGIEAVCVANVIKYLWRYELKDGIQSVEKAHWYLDRLIKELEDKA